jgi:iron-sulfur cluster assembly enzyme ISCU, mitochondrial
MMRITIRNVSNKMSPYRAMTNVNNNSNYHHHLPTRRMYHVNIVEHYENPRNVGSMDANDSHVGTGLVGAPACGDVMKLQIRISPEDGTIIESKFKTFGCGSAIASSSVATEWVKGKTVDEVLKIQNTDIAAHLKLPPVKLHCSMLAEDAIKAAVADWKQKQIQQKVAATE